MISLGSSQRVHHFSSISYAFFFLQIFILSFLFNNPLYLFILLGLFLIFIGISHHWNDAKVYLRFSIMIVIFIGIINILLISDGETVLYQYSGRWKMLRLFNITLESILATISSIERLILILLVFGMFNVIIAPDDLMKIMRKCHIPYAMILIITLSFQFFPILLNDLDHLKEVQKSQGIDVNSGNFLKRLKNRVFLLLPLLTNSLERSVQVSEALEARGFGVSKKRSDYFPIRLSGKDWFFLLVNVAVLAYAIFIRVLGHGYLDIYSKFSFNLLSMAIFIDLGIILIFFFILYSILLFWEDFSQ